MEWRSVVPVLFSPGVCFTNINFYLVYRGQEYTSVPQKSSPVNSLTQQYRYPKMTLCSCSPMVELQADWGILLQLWSQSLLTSPPPRLWSHPWKPILKFQLCQPSGRSFTTERRLLRNRCIWNKECHIFNTRFLRKCSTESKLIYLQHLTITWRWLPRLCFLLAFNGHFAWLSLINSLMKVYRNAMRERESEKSLKWLEFKLPHRSARLILSEWFQSILLSSAWRNHTKADERNCMNFYNPHLGGSGSSIVDCLSRRVLILGTKLHSSCIDTLFEDTTKCSDGIRHDTKDWTSCRGWDLRQSLDSAAIWWSRGLLVWLLTMACISVKKWKSNSAGSP